MCGSVFDIVSTVVAESIEYDVSVIYTCDESGSSEAYVVNLT